MTIAEIITLAAGLIADYAKIIADLHAGTLSPEDAEARIKASVTSFATERAAEDVEIQALPK